MRGLPGRLLTLSTSGLKQLSETWNKVIAAMFPDSRNRKTCSFHNPSLLTALEAANTIPASVTGSLSTIAFASKQRSTPKMIGICFSGARHDDPYSGLLGCRS